MSFNVDYFLNALPIMGKGMLGIFIVTIAIVLVVYLLNSMSGIVNKIANATYNLLTKKK